MGSNCLGWHMAMRSLWLAVEGGEAGAPGHIREREMVRRLPGGEVDPVDVVDPLPASSKKMSRKGYSDSSYG